MNDDDAKLAQMAGVTVLRKEGRHAEAFKALMAIADPSDHSVLQARYARILSSLQASASVGLSSLKVAVLSSSTDQFLRDVLRFWLARAGFQVEFFDSAYDTVTQTILAPDSSLYAFNPDIVWIFTTYRDIQIPVKFERSAQEIQQDIDEQAQRVAALWTVLQARCRAYIIQNNADLPAYHSLGNFDGVAPWSRTNILKQYNDRLIEALRDGVTLFDLEDAASFFGKEKWFELTQWYNSRIPFSLDAVGLVAHRAAQLISAIKGRAKKCLVLDLDNTLWGGVIADDGLAGIVLGDGPVGEAFVDFQRYVLELKERGIILAVCSKNNEDNAREPFMEHPDMRLKLDDISIFKANWDSKADNIQQIAEALNIGLDSIVFVDDNPAERALVREFLPQVAVPEMPQDPSLYRSMLDRWRFFETIATSSEDGRRTEFYRGNVARTAARNDFSDLTAYLKSLEMVAETGDVDAFHLPRAAQLINKSNQFHLTTTRYTENEVQALAGGAGVIGRYFTLKDKFGDNGLIAVVILKKTGVSEYVIDTWCMSCRVLSRGMEEYICQAMIGLCRERGIKRLLGVYIPTAKNSLVADLYLRLGFRLMSTDEEATTRWLLEVDSSIVRQATQIATNDE